MKIKKTKPLSLTDPITAKALVDASATEFSELFSVLDYIVFAQKVFALRSKRQKRHFGYSDLARAGGFAARSFPREVILGKRRLTSRSYPAFSRGLGLSGDLAEYFRYLVELKHSDCRTKLRSEEKILQTLGNLRDRLLKKNSVVPQSLDRFAFGSQFNPMVYSALGQPGKGASLKEIQNKTSLPSEKILECLQLMVDGQMIKRTKNRYFTIENHLSFPHLDQSQAYKAFYIGLLEQVKSKANGDFSSPSKLFFSSSFSVMKHDMPRLKEELRGVLLRFIDSSECSDGDQVVSIACSLF